MPPVETTERLSRSHSPASKTVVTEMGTPVIIEARRAARSAPEQTRVTPDPGVIEVNSTRANRGRTRRAHGNSLRGSAADAARRGKFMLDGRHTGTGGAIILLLAAKLRELADFAATGFVALAADVLADHPSLSWLFSGLFIGPTSQAPRIDEARNDSLYDSSRVQELDRNINTFATRRRACATDVPKSLIDASGNTHRANFHDKTFAPTVQPDAVGSSRCARLKCHRTRA